MSMQEECNKVQIEMNYVSMCNDVFFFFLQSFQRSNDGSNASEATSVCFVGLYGMGGSGKTTMSKVLCNNMMQEFLGKVCRIEFGAHGFLDLCKQVIRCTTNYEEMFLSKVNDAELVCYVIILC